MARVFTYPFEQGTTAEWVGGTSGTAPTFSTEHPQSGGRSLKFGSGATGRANLNITGGALERHYYFRDYIYFNKLPTTGGEILFAEGAAEEIWSLQAEAGGGVRLYGKAFATLFSTETAVFKAEAQNRVELHWFLKTGACQMELRINGTTLYTNTTTANLFVETVTNIRVKAEGLGAGVETWHDNVALNDSTGTKETSWVGDGKTTVLPPISDKARTGWVAGGAVTTEKLWEALDNVPPVGVATGSSTHGSQIKDAENNATDTYQANIQSYTAGGVGAGDTIKLVQGIFRVGSSTTTSRTLGLKGISNPEITEETKTTGTTAAGTDPTGWNNGRTEVVYEPSVTKGTEPVLQVRKGTATTDVAMVSYLGLLVEYLPNEVTEVIAPTATATGSAPVPTVTTETTGKTVEAPTASATGVAPVATVSATQNPNIEAPTASATAEGVTPQVSVSVTVVVPTATATASAIVPSLSAGATIIAVTAAATGAGVVPTVTGEQNPTVVAVTAAAIASAIAAEVEVSIPHRPPAHAPNVVTAALEVFDRTGHKFRFGPEEEEVSRTLISHSYQTSATGGFGPGNFIVTAPSKYEPFAAGEFYSARLYAVETNETLYAGRVTGTPQNDKNSITIETEGWVNSLNDNQTAREIFIDRDLTNWVEPSTQRKINILKTNLYDFTKSSYTTGFTGSAEGPSILIQFSEFGSLYEITEVWYRASVELGQIKFDYIVPKAGGEVSGLIYSTETDTAPTVTGQTSTFTTSAVPNQTFNVPAKSDYLFIQQTYFGGFTGPSAGDTYGYSNIRVKGRHGLEAHGVGINEGLLVSDMAAYIVGKWAPLLRFTTGQGGTIEPTALPVAQAAFNEDTTGGEMLKALQVYGGNADAVLDIGCYGDDGKEFYMRSAPYGKEWIVRREGNTPNAIPTSAGPDSSQFINGIKIVYDPDGSGQKKSVGPIGSGASIESSTFEDADPSNPANADGSLHYVVRDIGINSQEMAEAVAAKELAYRNSQDWRGSITIKGEVEDTAGNLFPAGRIRGGDTITVADDQDPLPRRIESTSGSALEASVDIGAPPDKISTMLARAELAQQGRIES